MKRPIRLEQRSSDQIGELIASGKDLVMLPIGATEQHGPHLPINTDTVIAERICHEASARSGVPVLPTVAYTVSSGHTAQWPGTISLRHATFIDSMVEISEWVVASGWKRLMFVNSHFGNDASLRVAIEKIRLLFLGQLQVGLQHTFKLTPAVWDYFISDAEDLHANRAETDLMLHLAPETVSMDRVSDDPDRTEGTVFSYPVAQTSLNGITGSPSLGCAERGATLFEEMVVGLVETLEIAQAEEPPVPEGAWKNTRIPHL